MPQADRPFSRLETPKQRSSLPEVSCLCEI